MTHHADDIADDMADEVKSNHVVPSCANVAAHLQMYDVTAATVSTKHTNTATATQPRTLRRMTRYEYARIKGLRMEQLSRGFIPYVRIPNMTPPLTLGQITCRELYERCSAFIIVRNSLGWNERISVTDMDYSRWLANDPDFMRADACINATHE